MGGGETKHWDQILVGLNRLQCVVSGVYTELSLETKAAGSLYLRVGESNDPGHGI